jgi:nitrogen fixation/metabolism regulation signal transduction histidine kinase
MSEAATAPAPAAGGRHQRRLRNYLLDTHFQLKYTSYLIGIAIVLSVSLGLILWRTGRSVIAQSEEAVRQGEQAVDLGREVLSESQKVSAVVKMNIVKDPVYADNPALLDAFSGDTAVQDALLASQQRQLETQASALKQQSAKLAERQQTMFTALFVALGLLVVGIGVVGIVVTHKVAGPIYKMKRQIKELGNGKFKLPGKLRKGDELVDFFETFEHTVQNLRAHQQEEIEKLDRAIARLAESAPEDAMKPLRELRADMQSALEP